MIADGSGRAVAFTLAPGQAHELPHAIPLLDALPSVPLWVVADRGYSSHAFREYIRERGATPAIPARRNEGPLACPDWVLQQQEPGRAPLGQIEGVESRSHPLRENRHILHGRPLPRRRPRLDQALTGPRLSSWEET